MKYNYDYCKSIVEKCIYKKDVYKNHKYVYESIIKHKWYDLLNNLKQIGNRYKRCIYVFIIENKYAYVGLTYNLEERLKGHKRKGTVYDFCRTKNFIIPNPIQLTDYIDYKEAVILEEIYVNEYKNKGYIMLNKEKTGGLGGVVFKDDPTTDEIIQLLKKCNSRSEFRHRYPHFWTIIEQNDLLKIVDEILPRQSNKKRMCVFDSTGKYIETVDSITSARKKYKASILGEYNTQYTSSNNYIFTAEEHWLQDSSPLQINSINDILQKSHKIRITKMLEKFATYGNKQKGQKRPLSLKIKLGKPVVVLDLKNIFIGLYPSVTIAFSELCINKKPDVSVCKNKIDKSLHGYRWFDLDEYNKQFKQNLQYETKSYYC